jgi:hypothetical protein
MMKATYEQLVRLAARIGNVEGLVMLTSAIEQIAGQLLLPVHRNRDELYQLKQCLAMVDETLICLRRAAALQLRVLGVEQNDAS